MAPLKAVPIIENVYTYCREDDGFNTRVRQIGSEEIRPRRKSSSDDHATATSSDDAENFIVGDRVWVGGSKPGTIAYIGETHFGPGDWAGVVLDDPCGKNDGAVAGTRYFQCPPNKGIFSKLARLTRRPSLSTITRPSYDNSYSSYSSYGSGSSARSTPSPTRGIKSKYSYGSMTPSGDLRIGDRVIVKSSHGSKAGVLRYYGTTEFGNGVWCGVELDDPLGKNDGSVGGIRYFDCASKFGLFVPAEKVTRSPVPRKTAANCVVHPQGPYRAESPTPDVRTKTVRVVKVYHPDWESDYF